MQGEEDWCKGVNHLLNLARLNPDRGSELGKHGKEEHILIRALEAVKNICSSRSLSRFK